MGFSRASTFALFVAGFVLIERTPGFALAAPGETVLSQAAPAKAEKPPVFETDVAPLLKAKCAKCHGEKERKADLDLGSPAAILKGGESGPAVVPKEAEKSLLYEKVVAGEMPPGKKDRLTEAELAIIRRWIEAGAHANADAPAADMITQHDVIPILLRRCTVCHGGRRQEAGLDVRTKASMLRGGKSGPAIVLEKPAESLVIQKIRAEQMPPLTRLIEVSIKPIEPSETEILEKWISRGAPEIEIQPDVATTEPDPLVSDKDREFWSFRPPQPQPPPRVKHAERVRNPIDAFILQKQEEKGLALSDEADRAVLLRRVTFDLTGLPPEPAEITAFLADRDSRAFEKVVDRLLSSPRYGERWGRHWLDLAGYADSEGKREQEITRHSAWRDRDYVICAFNSDKPYDRFLTQQIAGDELADYEHATEITGEMYMNLVATGFLRMAPDPTWFNLTNFIPDRLDVVADEIDVFSSTVLGLTMKCARCHTHKFDPIPHRDYFRLVDVFKGAFDEHDWMKTNWHNGLSMGVRNDRDLPYVSTTERQSRDEHNAKLQAGIAAENSRLDERARELTKKHEAERLAQIPETLRADVASMLSTPADKRSAVQAYLAEKFEKTIRVDRAELLKIDA